MGVLLGDKEGSGSLGHLGKMGGGAGGLSREDGKVWMLERGGNHRGQGGRKNSRAGGPHFMW